MPIDQDITIREWRRFQQVRDSGHDAFVKKADTCEQFFAGKQWRPEDLARLTQVGRPALTINKIKPTIMNVLGEQINSRAEISFRPAKGGNSDTADVLAKVFKQISNNNRLDWVRSDVFADGIISGRGFYDVRLDTSDSVPGEVRIVKLNKKNVLIDCDAEEYDPKTWSDVIVTKWYTCDDIEVMWGKADADLLRNRSGSYFAYGYDSIDLARDRFGQRNLPLFGVGNDTEATQRNVRVIERQHRVLDRQKHFVERTTGDMRPVPEEFTRDKIAFFREKFGFEVITKLVRRVRWTVIADEVLLHDDWSPYKNFTVVPYFPVFRNGETLGTVEDLLSSQELLNKASSQELHVVNTSANSGWKVKTGALTNMTVGELEEKGAQTGLVLEIADDIRNIEKITPNQVPQGFDRISFKAEDHIKSISGVNDSMQGFDREDVAAKAIDQKKKSGSTALSKPFDSLTRTDALLAECILDIVQEYYTDERIMTITTDSATGATEQVHVNYQNAAGEILNDLTLGEYDVVVVSVPHRETMEDSQFEQAMALKEAGIQIPDEIIINASRLQNKSEIIQQITGNKNSPEAQAAAQLQQQGQQAIVAKTQAEAQVKQADAGLRQAKTQQVTLDTQKMAQEPPEGQAAGQHVEIAKTAADLDLRDRAQSHKEQMDQRALMQKQSAHEDDLAMRERELQAQKESEQAAAVQAAARAALSPQKATT